MFIVSVKLNRFFYASITNDHRFTHLKQYKFIISQFCRSELCVSLTSSFPLSLMRPKSRHLLLGLRPFLMEASQLLEATCIPSHLGPSSFKIAKLCTDILTLHVSLTSASLLHHPENVLCIKGSCD